MMVVSLLASMALAGPCDAGTLEQTRQALSRSPKAASALAAQGIADACPPLRGAAELASVPPEHAMVVEQQIVMEVPDLWMARCTGGLQVLIKMVELPASKKRAHVWDGCGLGGWSVMTRDQWVNGTGFVILPLLADQLIRGSKAQGPIVRALAESGAPSKPEPKPDPKPEPEPEPEVDEKPARFKGGPPVVKWKGKAKRSSTFRCTVQVGVTPDGELRRLRFEECPQDLRKSVEKAMKKAEFVVARRDGERVPGKFDHTFVVPRDQRK